MRRFMGVLVVLMLVGCATPASIQQRDNDRNYHYRLGMAHLNEGSFQEALLAFLSAEEVDPDSEKVLFALGHTYFSQANFQAAEQMMTRIIELNPENGEALNYLGNIQERRGFPELAADSFSRAAETPGYHTPHFALHNLGRILQRRGDRAGAEHAYQEAINRVPEYYPARADLAKLYLDEARWADAARHWQLFLDLRPDLVDGYFYLARAFVGLNRPASAMDQLRQFIDKAEKSNPLLPDAQALLEDLQQ